jgi:hypothetical protein
MESIILNTSRRFIKVFLIAATAILASLFSPAAFAHGHPHPPQPPPDTCRLLVVGFTGGTEAPDWDSSGVVQIRYRLQNLHQPGLCVHTFSAYYWWLSKAWVRERFGATADEQLTPEQGSEGDHLRPQFRRLGHHVACARSSGPGHSDRAHRADG